MTETLYKSAQGEASLKTAIRYPTVAAAVSRLPSHPSDERAFWKNAFGAVCVKLQEKTLSSHFLPITERQSGDVLGHFAIASGELGQSESLDFNQLDDVPFVATDRLLRALHTLNYFGRFDAPVRLFLDVNHRFLSSVAENHGAAFRGLVESLGLAAHHFVIQVVVSNQAEFNTYAFAADNYRRNGFSTSLYCRHIEQIHGLIGQIRPDFLTFDLDNDCSVDQIRNMVLHARDFHVQLIGKGSIDHARMHELQLAGIRFFNFEKSGSS